MVFWIISQQSVADLCEKRPHQEVPCMCFEIDGTHFDCIMYDDIHGNGAVYVGF